MLPLEKAHESPLRQPRNFQAYFLCIVFCFWFATYIYVPPFGVYLDSLNIGYYYTGLIMGSYGIMQIAMRFPLGIMADKYNIDGKLIVAFGFISAIASNVLLAVSSTFLPIFFGRFLAGVTAAMWVVITIWYSSSFDEKKSLKAMGHLQTTTVASQLISMAVSGVIAKILGYSSLFWIGGVFAIIGMVLVLFLPGKSDSEHINRRHAAKDNHSVIVQIVKERKLWSASILSMLSHAALFATMFGFSPVYFHGLNNRSSAMIFLVVAFMLPHTLAPMLLSAKKSSLSNPFLAMCGCFVLAACSLSMMTFTSNWILYCLLNAVFGFFLGFVFPILLDQVYRTETSKASKTVMGFYQSVYSIGIVAGPIAAGIIAKQANIKYVFILPALLLIAGGIISVYESLKSKGNSLEESFTNNKKELLKK